MAVTTRSHSAKRKPLTPPKGSKLQEHPTPRTPTTRTTRKTSSPKTPARTRSSAPASKSKSPRGKKISRLSNPSEYELDERGKAIEDPFTGRPNLSKYGWRVFAERTRHVAMARPPSLTLDNRLRPRYQGPLQPMLHYGIACNMSEILEWERRMSYRSRPGDTDPEETAMYRLQSFLNCRGIGCSIEYALSTEYEFVIALYSNHDQLEKQFVEEDERDCLRIICTELQLGDRPPMWWWDRMKSGTYYTCAQDEYNVPNLYDIVVTPEDSDWE